jgi:hypothetical protein
MVSLLCGYPEIHEDFDKCELDISMCVTSLSAAFVWNIFSTPTYIDIYLVTFAQKNYVLIGLHVKYPLYLSSFNQNRYMRPNCIHSSPLSNLMSIPIAVLLYFHRYGRTDGTQQMLCKVVKKKPTCKLLIPTEFHRRPHWIFGRL